MKLAFASLLVAALGLVIAPGLSSLWPDRVTFRSLESITGSGAPVFNEIAFQSAPNADIWLMRQSPRDMTRSKNSWSRLAIVVDKQKHTAKFFELAAGELAFEPNKAIALKATCVRCHVSGPRAVRPSPQIHLDTFARAKIFIWNLRIKTYGPLAAREGHHFESGEPLYAPEPILARELKLESCTRCHSAGGLRNALHLGQLATIHFMVKSGFMPPFPFRISQSDRQTIDRFVH